MSGSTRLGWFSEMEELLLRGNRKLLNAGREERKTGMKGLKGWGIMPLNVFQNLGRRQNKCGCRMKSSKVCPKAGRAKWNGAYTLVRGAEGYWMKDMFRMFLEKCMERSYRKHRSFIWESWWCGQRQVSRLNERVNPLRMGDLASWRSYSCVGTKSSWM